MLELKINVGMLAATCALCTAEVGVESSAYKNILAATFCVACGAFGLYLGFNNVKTAGAKTKGLIKGRVRKAREKNKNL